MPNIQAPRFLPQLAHTIARRGARCLHRQGLLIPSQSRLESVTDDAELEEVYNTERHLLYVACTRARDNLHMSAVSPASEFLDDLL